MMRPLYQIVNAERPRIWVRPAEAHALAEHLLVHPFWIGTVRPALRDLFFDEGEPSPRDGIEESADKVSLPRGIIEPHLIALQSIIDGWVATKGDA